MYIYGIYYYGKPNKGQIFLSSKRLRPTWASISNLFPLKSLKFSPRKAAYNRYQLPIELSYYFLPLIKGTFLYFLKYLQLIPGLSIIF